MKTTNITLAAALKSHGYPLKNVEVEDKRGIFYFDNIPEEEIEKFDLGNSAVEPNAFHSALRQLSDIAMKRMNK